MKKKKVVKVLIILSCFLVVAGAVLLYVGQKKMMERKILRIDYREQNDALPLMPEYPVFVEEYVGYDAIDKEELYVRLAAYNERMRSEEANIPELTLADVEEYLSGEYNEDGSLRIQKGYENIRSYVKWFYKKEGDKDIAAYWMELRKIAMGYYVQNSEITIGVPEEMSIAQLQELINKKNDPSYEINMEVMKE